MCLGLMSSYCLSRASLYAGQGGHTHVEEDAEENRERHLLQHRREEHREAEDDGDKQCRKALVFNLDSVQPFT